MNKSATLPTLTEKEEKEIHAKVQTLLEEMDQIDLRIEADQREIHRSQSRIQARLDSLKAFL